MPTGRGFSLFGGAKLKSVQYGTVTLSSVHRDVVVSISSSVNVAKSIIIYRATARYDYNTFIRGEFVGDTQIKFVNLLDYDARCDVTVDWFVVEFESGINIQSGYASYIADTNVTDVTISSVDVSKSFVLVHPYASSTVADFNRVHTRAILTSSTNLRLTQQSASSSGIRPGCYWVVLSFED